MNTGCLECSGDGRMANGEPCPVCSKMLQSKAVRLFHSATVPMQYQGVAFDRMFLPVSLQKPYGEFMEDLLTTISNDYNIYQKNLLICSRPNSGKTVWAYNLIMLLTDKGYDVPTVLDLMTVREHLNYRSDDKELQRQVEYSRCLIVRIPSDIQFWMFSIIQAILERRVAHNGFTVFLYSGTYNSLESADRDGVLKSIIGSGAFHTIKLEDFTK